MLLLLLWVTAKYTISLRRVKSLRLLGSILLGWLYFTMLSIWCISLAEQLAGQHLSILWLLLMQLLLLLLCSISAIDSLSFQATGIFFDVSFSNKTICINTSITPSSVSITTDVSSYITNITIVFQSIWICFMAISNPPTWI